MTGYDIYTRAMTLLGYTDENGNIEGGAGPVKRALAAVNHIGSDLCGMSEAESIFDTISISKGQQEAMVYGVAMLLALGDGDSGKNKVFCELYNMKRAAAKSETNAVSDKLPVVSEV